MFKRPVSIDIASILIRGMLAYIYIYTHKQEQCTEIMLRLCFTKKKGKQFTCFTSDKITVYNHAGFFFALYYFHPFTLAKMQTVLSPLEFANMQPC